MAENGSGKFDVAYVDGSHAARDVMSDGVMCWELLRRGGVMAGLVPHRAIFSLLLFFVVFFPPQKQKKVKRGEIINLLFFFLGAAGRRDARYPKVFDDYAWDQVMEHLPPKKCPRMAIDAFLAMFKDELLVLELGYQCVVQKIV